MAEIITETISQDELSQILGGNVESIILPSEESKNESDKKDIKVEKNEEVPELNGKFKQVDNTAFEWDDIVDSSKKEDDDIEEDESTSKNIDKPKVEDKKPVGRPTKPDNIISLVNLLVEEGSLTGFEDGEVKTADEATELIKLNLQNTKESASEDFWKSKIESYSPQVQAIIHYAETGGTDITPLLSAISQVENISNVDISKESGQEKIIGEYLKIDGWAENEINEEIDFLKDTDKLETKANFFLPKLQKIESDKIEQIMVEQQEVERQKQEARENYLTTIRTTLDKEKLGDISLAKSEKATIWDSLTNIKYKTWNGQPTNGFFKKLEEIQAGKTADYDHFMEIVYLTVNKEGYKNKLREQIKSEVAANTARKLRIAESKKASGSEIIIEDRKPGIKKVDKFKNPWS